MNKTLKRAFMINQYENAGGRREKPSTIPQTTVSLEFKIFSEFCESTVYLQTDHPRSFNFTSDSIKNL